MEDINKASLFVFVIALIFAVASFAHYTINIRPQYQYLSEVIDILQSAQKAITFEDKKALVEMAYTVYTSGVSQQHLQSFETLRNSTTAGEMDYWLPKVTYWIDGEQNNYIVTLRQIATAASIFGLLGTTFFGSFSDISDDDKSFYSHLVTAFFVAMVVSVIP